MNTNHTSSLLSFPVRFHGMAKLIGPAAFTSLQNSHVCLIGIGGVGSWTAEALARSGVGEFTLIDLDDICESNVNRQIHSLSTTVGKSKIAVMGQRILDINPAAKVHLRHDFATESSLPEILSAPYDYVFDAIDSLPSKCWLAALCRERQIPLLIAGGVGGLLSAQEIRIEDLTECHHDKLLTRLRKKLRQDFSFPRESEKLAKTKNKNRGVKKRDLEKGKWHLDVIYSPAPRQFLWSDGQICSTLEKTEADEEGQASDGERNQLNCQGSLGTASFVTGAFGLAAAGYIVQKLMKARKE